MSIKPLFSYFFLIKEHELPTQTFSLLTKWCCLSKIIIICCKSKVTFYNSFACVKIRGHTFILIFISSSFLLHIYFFRKNLSKSTILKQNNNKKNDCIYDILLQKQKKKLIATFTICILWLVFNSPLYSFVKKEAKISRFFWLFDSIFSSKDWSEAEKLKWICQNNY